MAPPFIVGHVQGLGRTGCFKKGVSQPNGIVGVKVERVAKHAGFVATPRVRRAQAVVLDFAKFEDRPIAARQTHRHAGTRTLRMVGHGESMTGRYSGARVPVDRSLAGTGGINEYR